MEGRNYFNIKVSHIEPFEYAQNLSRPKVHPFDSIYCENYFLLDPSLLCAGHPANVYMLNGALHRSDSNS